MNAEERKIIKAAIAILDKQVKSNEFHLSKPQDSISYLRLKTELSEREIFSVIFLNTKHYVIAVEQMFLGTIASSEVHPREVVKRALQLNAAAVIFSHNHPSGVSKASDADERVTRKLQQALSFVDISVLDHIVIGAGEYYSFSENGLL